MKHLKTYEIATETLKEGDCIMVNLEPINTISRKVLNLPIDNDLQPAQIIKIYDMHEFAFLCKFKNGVNYDMHKDEILRKLTKEEYNDFIIHLNANKYNL